MHLVRYFSSQQTNVDFKILPFGTFILTCHLLLKLAHDNDSKLPASTILARQPQMATEMLIDYKEMNPYVCDSKTAGEPWDKVLGKKGIVEPPF